ncbi:MAG: amylo-alpha-1,6-glucosidase [Bilophila wadsworthia]
MLQCGVFGGAGARLAYQEDLFQPGQFEIRLVPGKPVFLTASTEALQAEHGHNVIGEVWRRKSNAAWGWRPPSESLEGHLAREGERFLVRRPDGGLAVTAGYHWFGSWGRDTLIARSA